MGVIYKLKPKVADFILEKKRTAPEISCRKLTVLIEKKFKFKISKSTVNSAIKKSGLSMPIGRRRKRRRMVLSEAGGTGAVILKAADSLTGGTASIVETIKEKLGSADPELLVKTEALLYQPLSTGSESPEALDSYLKQLQGVKELSAQIPEIIAKSMQEVRCVKAEIAGLNLYLDGQMHTLWSTTNIPYNFSTTLYNINSYLKNDFQQDKQPLVLFMAPGYEKPKKEFFEFISSLNASGEELAKFTLLGNKLEELGVVRMAETKKRRGFVFGLWPWQFANFRKIKSDNEFRSFTSEITQEEFFIAEAEVELLQPIDKQPVTLRGCALKSRIWEKNRLIILTNLNNKEISIEELVNLYLIRWPNLEETFQDFSKKIELFTYAASSKRFLPTETLGLDKPAGQDIRQALDIYLKALDMYARWHFLPPGYENKDFPTVKERFYSLKAQFLKQEGYCLAVFKPPQEYPFLNDLEYLCRRLNEREIIFGPGQRLLFTIA